TREGTAARHPQSTIPAQHVHVCADFAPTHTWSGSVGRAPPKPPARILAVQRQLADGIMLDDDPQRIDTDAVHDFIANHSYWAEGRPRETMARLVRDAHRVVGLYDGACQIGFARAFTDGTSIVYLADVYVLPDYRGRGFGVELVREMIDNGPYADRSWLLHTRDAHALYRRFGFTDPSERVMERPRP